VQKSGALWPGSRGAKRSSQYYDLTCENELINSVDKVTLAGGFEQRVGLSINLPKELIGKVLFEINREVGQGLFKGVDVGSFHNLPQRGTEYTVLYTVSPEQTNR